MARPLRIEYPDAWYHAMNRGRRAEAIFSDATDYQCFVDLLKETSEQWGVRIAAYCLMPNHYHLLIQTPQANLSRSMRHINGLYTQRYNRRHRCDGQLFRGRYKSILVEADNYLLRLLRYIHKNPVRAGLAGSPGNYVWSSHKAYLSSAREWDWLDKSLPLSMIAPDQKKWWKEYERFMAEEDEGVDDILVQKTWPSFLGSADFVEWVKDRFYKVKTGGEIPQARELSPEMDRIIQVVSEFYNADEPQLYLSKRGSFNEPRNVAIYLARKLRRDTLAQISERFSINGYSTVSSIIVRTEERMKTDLRLKMNILALTTLVEKRQEQT